MSLNIQKRQINPCRVFFLLFFFFIVPLQAEALAPIDVVIPAIKKDQETLELCIEGIRTHGKNIRRIIVISPERLTEKAEWFPEKKFPFNKEKLAREIFGSKKAAKAFLKKPTTIGWIYQQFLKLYACRVIPGVAPNLLVLDADTIFLKKVVFLDEDGHGLYNVGAEFHSLYFSHMERLLPDLKKVYPDYSGICHHMLFQRPVLEELFQKIEKEHKKEAWKAIARAIDSRETMNWCLSEYEIYFNYVFSQPNRARVRKLKWANIGDLAKIPEYEAEGYDYVSCHSYLRSSSM